MEPEIAYVGNPSGIEYHTASGTDFDSPALDGEPHFTCPIPGAERGVDAYELQIWHDYTDNRTYIFAAGEFMNQELVYVKTIISIEVALKDYLAEMAEGQ